MASQEDRIIVLEETISEYQSVLQGITYELTKIRGFIVTQTEITLRLKQDIKELSQGMETSFKQLSTYLGTIETRLDRQDECLGTIETDIIGIKTRLDRQDVRLGTIETDITDIKTHFERQDKRFDRQDARFDRMETLLTQIVERLPKAP